MTIQTQNSQELREEEKTSPERTRQARTYVPRADVYETEEAIFVVAEMPGVSEGDVDITLEKNVLILTGNAGSSAPEGYNVVYREYHEGDYERRFALSNSVDREGIEATMTQGVLTLKLPKAKEAVPRKIAVKAS